MPFKEPDLKDLQAYHRAMKREAHAIINGKTHFCLYTEVDFPAAEGAKDGAKGPKVKPFLVIGSDQAAMASLLSDMKGSKRLLSKGTCSVKDGKIELTATSGKLPYQQLKATTFRELLGGKQIHIPTGKENEKDDDEGPEEKK